MPINSERPTKLGQLLDKYMGIQNLGNESLAKQANAYLIDCGIEDILVSSTAISNWRTGIQSKSIAKRHWTKGIALAKVFNLEYLELETFLAAANLNSFEDLLKGAKHNENQTKLLSHWIKEDCSETDIIPLELGGQSEFQVVQADATSSLTTPPNDKKLFKRSRKKMFLIWGTVVFSILIAFPSVGFLINRQRNALVIEVPVINSPLLVIDSDSDVCEIDFRAELRSTIPCKYGSLSIKGYIDIWKDNETNQDIQGISRITLPEQWQAVIFYEANEYDYGYVGLNVGENLFKPEGIPVYYDQYLEELRGNSNEWEVNDDVISITIYPSNNGQKLTITEHGPEYLPDPNDYGPETAVFYYLP